MKFFSPTAYIFRFRPSSGGNFWSKLVRLFSLILQFLSKQCFCLQEYYLCREFRQYWTIFGWVRAQKPHKKGHLMDAESVRKTLKTFNSISNAIMMKLTTIMYLHKRLNRKPLRTKNSILGVMSSNFWNKWKTTAYVCITLRYITGKVFVQIPWKATQNRSKMIATQTFEGL